MYFCVIGFYVTLKLWFPLAAVLIHNHFSHYILHLQFAIIAAFCTLPLSLQAKHPVAQFCSPTYFTFVLPDMPSNCDIHLLHLWDVQTLPEHHIFIIQVAFHVWHCTLKGHDHYQLLFSSGTTHLLCNRHATYSTEYTQKNVEYSKVAKHIYLKSYIFRKHRLLLLQFNNTMYREVGHTESEGIHYVSGFQLSTTLTYTWTTFSHQEKQILYTDSIFFQRNIKPTIFNRQKTWFMPF